MGKIICLLMIIGVFVTGCGNVKNSDHFETKIMNKNNPDYKPVEEIHFTEQVLNMQKGEDKVLGYTLTPIDATNKSVSWESSDENVLTVSDGYVHAVGVGTATIKVIPKDNTGLDSICVITVYEGVLSVTLNKHEINLAVGESETLSATVVPSNLLNNHIDWSSDNTNVAQVDFTGEVIAVGIGTAKIYAKSEFGNKSDFCTVTVNNYFSSVQILGLFELSWGFEVSRTTCTSIGINTYEVTTTEKLSGGKTNLDGVVGANHCFSVFTNGTYSSTKYGMEKDVLSDSNEEIILIGKRTNEALSLKNIYVNLEDGYNYKFTVKIKSTTEASIKIEKVQ